MGRSIEGRYSEREGEDGVMKTLTSRQDLQRVQDIYQFFVTKFTNKTNSAENEQLSSKTAAGGETRH
jgi:hypothetical protein